MSNNYPEMRAAAIKGDMTEAYNIAHLDGQNYSKQEILELLEDLSAADNNANILDCILAIEHYEPKTN